MLPSSGSFAILCEIYLNESVVSKLGIPKSLLKLLLMKVYLSISSLDAVYFVWMLDVLPVSYIFVLSAVLCTLILKQHTKEIQLTVNQYKYYIFFLFRWL